jgi:hypothetical protein
MTHLLERVGERESTAEQVRGSLSERLSEPFAAAAVLYILSTAIILLAGLRLTGGRFIYPIDDVYINMAVAKNFALHGVWGVSPFAFNSTTSSPLYVALLAMICRIVGLKAFLYVPLILSWSFGMGAVWVASRMVRDYLSKRGQTIALVLFVLLTPMFVLGALGMEHAMHLLLTLLFLRAFQDETRAEWHVGLLTALMVGARYEGLMMAAVAVLVLGASRRWLRAAVIGVSAWIPVLLYGAFSVAHGGWWLPNSVAIKGLHVTGFAVAARLSALGERLSINWQGAPHLALLGVAMLAMALPVRKANAKVGNLLLVLGGASVLHLLTAQVGMAFRYEAYLVGGAIVAVASAWPLLWSSRSTVALSGACVAMLAAGVLLLRAGLAADMMPQFPRAIYEQQWQMGRFLAQSYPGAEIAANDIGAINYLADLHCFDLVGLASPEVFAAKRAGVYTTSFLERAGDEHGLKVIVVYDPWFAVHPLTPLGGPALPASWMRVERWSVPARLQLGGATVSFYARNAADAAQLKARLAEFDSTLPARVSVDHK